MKRTRARRNPQLLGASLPPLKSIMFVGTGLVLPPIVATQLMKFLPIEWQTSKPAFYAVKAASVFLPGMLIKKVVSREAGNLFMLGGLASFAIDALRETGLLTTLGLSGYSVSQPMLGFYPGAGGPSNALGRMRGLGRYHSGNSSLNAPRPLTMAPMIANTPERLNPSARY